MTGNPVSVATACIGLIAIIIVCMSLEFLLSHEWSKFISCIALGIIATVIATITGGIC